MGGMGLLCGKDVLLLVELEVKIVGQLYLVTIGLLINLHDGEVRIVGGDIVGDALRDDGCRHGLGLAIDLCPLTLLVEVYLGVVGEPDAVGGAVGAAFLFHACCIEAREMGGQECLCLGRQVLKGDYFVIVVGTA